ncbi:hypothetical protein [Sphingomonas piscis]|uniref:hypothetical protein n=1 Tax=Sphingomonas piscis TaxID=2714943 RepID=UPI001FE7C704|nr:hypothetical protein [Sphingomonas piscis]
MRKLLTASLIVMAAPAAAQTMNADVFHRRATALMRKGPLALFSRGEINALMNEGQAAGRAVSARRKADVAAGRKPRFCPPEGAKHSMASDEFMKRLSAIPAAQRARIDMTEATTRILAGKYPCR